MRAFRHVRGLTFALLAERTAVSVERISEIEHGQHPPAPEIIHELAYAFECATEDLMTTGDPMDNHNYWIAASIALPPLSARAVRSIADALDRIDARRNPTRPSST